MKKTVAIVLVILGLLMIYLGIYSRILPPAVTGVGFIAIAMVFFRKEA